MLALATNAYFAIAFFLCSLSMTIFFSVTGHDVIAIIAAYQGGIAFSYMYQAVFNQYVQSRESAHWLAMQHQREYINEQVEGVMVAMNQGSGNGLFEDEEDDD